MASTAELLINITANAGEANGVLSELQQQTRQLEQIMANTGSTVEKTAKKTEESAGAFGKFGAELNNIGKMAVGMATGMLAANVAMSISERIANAAEQIDTYGKAVLSVQRITGDTAANSSALVAIFEKYTPSLDEATTRLSRFEKALAGQEDIEGITTTGGKTAGQFLQEFGVSAEVAASQTIPAIEKLAMLAEGFKHSTDEQQKNLALTAIMGRGSQSMLLMLDQGRAGIEATAAAAEKYGLTLTGENLDDVLRFTLAHKDMDLAMQGIAVQLGAVFMPAITRAAEATAGFAGVLATSLTPQLKAVADSPATGALLGIGSGMVVLAAAAKVASVVLTPLTAMFAVIGAAVYTFSQPLRDAIDTLYQLKAAYNSLPQEAFSTPVLGGAATTARDLLNKLPGNSAGDLLASSASAEAGAGAEGESGTGAFGSKAATAAADVAKAQLQGLQNAQAGRKAQFDIDSLADAQQLLTLKSAEVEANSALVEYKRQIEDIDRNAVNFARDRLQLEEQRASLLAQQSASPLQNASADITFQENEIKAQIAASRSGGSAVDRDALRQQLHSLQQQGRQLEPGLLAAEHNVALANRAKSATDLDAQLAANTTAGQKLGVTEAMAPADAAAVIAKRQVEDQQHVVDLEKQRFDLTEKGFQAEMAIAEAREKAASAELFLIQNRDKFPTFGPAPVAGAGGEGPAVTHQGDINVTVNGVNASDPAHVDNMVDQVKAAVVDAIAAAWQAAMQGTPVAGALGGSFATGSAPR